MPAPYINSWMISDNWEFWFFCSLFHPCALRVGLGARGCCGSSSTHGPLLRPLCHAFLVVGRCLSGGVSGGRLPGGSSSFWGRGSRRVC